MDIETPIAETSNVVSDALTTASETPLGKAVAHDLTIVIATSAVVMGVVVASSFAKKKLVEARVQRRLEKTAAKPAEPVVETVTTPTEN